MLFAFKNTHVFRMICLPILLYTSASKYISIILSPRNTYVHTHARAQKKKVAFPSKTNETFQLNEITTKHDNKYNYLSDMS